MLNSAVYFLPAVVLALISGFLSCQTPAPPPPPQCKEVALELGKINSRLEFIEGELALAKTTPKPGDLPLCEDNN